MHAMLGFRSVRQDNIHEPMYACISVFVHACVHITVVTYLCGSVTPRDKQPFLVFLTLQLLGTVVQCSVNSLVASSWCMLEL